MHPSDAGGANQMLPNILMDWRMDFISLEYNDLYDTMTIGEFSVRIIITFQVTLPIWPQ